MISKAAAALGVSGFQIRRAYIGLLAAIAAATPDSFVVCSADTLHNCQPPKTLTGKVIRFWSAFNTPAALFVSAAQLCGGSGRFGAAVADAVPKDRIFFALLLRPLHNCQTVEFLSC